MKKLLMFFMLFTSAVFAQEQIGEVGTNGIFIKDKLKIFAIDDPDLKGITIYVTYYSRSLSLNDSGRSSITVVKTGNISGTPSSKKNIYKDRKGWTFKGTNIDRFYDSKRNVLIYIAYLDSIDDKNSYHQISSVSLN